MSLQLNVDKLKTEASNTSKCLYYIYEGEKRVSQRRVGLEASYSDSYSGSGAEGFSSTVGYGTSLDLWSISGYNSLSTRTTLSELSICNCTLEEMII